MAVSFFRYPCFQNRNYIDQVHIKIVRGCHKQCDNLL